MLEQSVDAAEATKKAICWPFVKPSDGLEPSTPSLPSSAGVGTAGHGRVREGRNVLLVVRIVADCSGRRRTVLVRLMYAESTRRLERMTTTT